MHVRGLPLVQESSRAQDRLITLRVLKDRGPQAALVFNPLPTLVLTLEAVNQQQRSVQDSQPPSCTIDSIVQTTVHTADIKRQNGISTFHRQRKIWINTP